jgi:hypothetical protein
MPHCSVLASRFVRRLLVRLAHHAFRNPVPLFSRKHARELQRSLPTTTIQANSHSLDFTPVELVV